MKELFTFSVEIIGISAPWFSWVAAVVLVLWPIWEMKNLSKLSRRQKAICTNLVEKIKDLKIKYPLQGSHGLNSIAIDLLDQLFTSVPFFKGQWNVFRSKLIYRPIPGEDDAEQVWAIESATSIFPEDNFLGNDFNKRRFLAIPGIVTGIGLLMTFVAILVGLWGVSIDKATNRVFGLENLIGGLSGKFISSVAALISATGFLLFEKRVFHRINGFRLSLTTAIDSLVPRRSESHLLEEISQNIAEQTNAFRMFNTDLSLKLRNSFSESMGPTLERMVNAIDNLNKLTDSSKAELLESIREMNQLLKRSEQTRQESISGQVEGLLKNLQKSLSESIDRMSREFSTSLTGNAQDQFKRVAESVGATAEVLTNTQSALQELITLAKQSTENQFHNSSALIERMVNTLGDTMGQLVSKIDGLSAKMTSTIEGTAERSAEAAGSIINEMRDLTSQSMQRFFQVLEKHEQQMDKVDIFKNTLHDAIEEFGEYVTGYNEINRSLQDLSTSANSVMERLYHSSQQIKECQESFMKIADLTGSKIKLLAESHADQKELWNDINTSMGQYRKTFIDIESNATNILATISEHLQDFSRVTQEHFNKTISVANDHVSEAVGQLQTSIEQLSEKLEYLEETVSQIDKMYRTVKRQ